MRFIFVGGGTGGHLTPGIGLAEELVSRGHECCFLCNGREVERNYFGPQDHTYSLGMDQSGMPRVAALLRGMLRARRFARSYQPDLLIALGGAGSVAALAMGRRAPMVALEGNFVVGKSVRLLDRFSTSTLTLFPETALQLRRGRCVGPIARSALQQQNRDLACARFGLAPDRPILLLLGGSQGARDLNQAVQRMIPRLAQAGAQLLAACGPGKVEALQQASQKAGLSAHLMEHCAEMGAAYSAADFVLSRGGAATMAELWLYRLPAAVVPYPYHRDRQQEHNAQALHPGVIVLNQLDAVAENRIMELLLDPLQRRRMASYLEQCAPVDGCRRAVDLLEEIASRKS
jgi:UDP-N-acetylglucosamine--N-acetylmuramyl-(pentapeptide) pyrophosphoryl-undecaprenol N-acetylglucosamine transferase